MLKSEAQMQKSPLDFIAEAYLDDYHSHRPIDGGILLESELRACDLNSTMASLRRIDGFLDKVQQQTTERPDLFMQNALNRNMVLFIGFYMGHVLTKTLKIEPIWLGQADLINKYPNLAVHPQNPFHFMALEYPKSESDTLEHANDTPAKQRLNNHLFFVMESIALKIFGSKIKMPPVVDERIAPNVYSAVFMHLPESMQADILETEKVDELNRALKRVAAVPETDVSNPQSNLQSNPQPFSVGTTEELSKHSSEHGSIDLQPDVDKNVNGNSLQYVQQDSIDNSDNSKSLTQLQPKAQVKSEAIDKPINDLQHPIANNVISEQPDFNDNAVDYKNTIDYKEEGESASKDSDLNELSQQNQHSSLPQKLTHKRDDEFKDLRHDLETLTVDQDEQTPELTAMYQRAAKVLSKIDKLVAGADLNDNANEKDLPADSTKLLDVEVQKVFKQALSIIVKTANKGHTASMLRLAIYYFLGEGVVKDEEKGFEWVQKAAKLGDIRAIRQMSRLYYQGIGCEQDMELGRYWLNEAAENGHQEAANLLQSWDAAQTIIEEKKVEDNNTKRYLIIIGILLFIAALIIIFL